ncbi:hypothetical protein LPJ59_005846, partial [Coemansia sp. RSA 2399]
MYQLPSEYRPTDYDGAMFEVLAAPALLRAYRRLPQEAQRTLAYHLRIWARYEHDVAHLSQICNDPQEEDEYKRGANILRSRVSIERCNIEEEIDEILKTFRSPALFSAPLVATPDKPGNASTVVFSTPQTQVKSPRYVIRRSDGIEDLVKLPCYGTGRPGDIEDLLEFLELFTDALKLCDVENDWKPLLRLSVGGDMRDVVKEIGEDDLDWSTARQVIEKRLFRPIHCFRLFEAAIEGYQGSAATPYERICHNIKLAKKLRVLSFEELLFYIAYYRLDPESRKE